MSETFPPLTQTSVINIIPAYAYKQYEDDDNIVTFFDSYNQLAQQYLDWINGIGLPVYTGTGISGSLLDWVAEGLYGIKRPAISSGHITVRGPLNTWLLNTILINGFETTGSINVFFVNDDIFKRIITWHFFKGDGKIFSIEWLKRRVMRFLIGIFGTAPNIDEEYPVSVTFGTPPAVTVTITTGGAIQLADAQIFQAAVASAVVELPFQHAFNVVLV